MYKITDEDIAFIEDDLTKRGITMEDLRNSLIDHICCVAENTEEEISDFRKFYVNALAAFYQNDISEIQKETILLLKNKNYYIMNKAMIISGILSVFTLIAGCLFKLFHWPAAGPLLILGILLFTFVFLPIVFLLKSGELKSLKTRLKLALGGLVCMLYSLFIVFLVHHWPGANWFIFSAIGISFFIYIPYYFFTGISNPETKINTIINTVLLVAVTTLQFTIIKIY